MKKSLCLLTFLWSISGIISAETVDIIGFTRTVNGSHGGNYFGGYKVSKDRNSIDCSIQYGSALCDTGSCEKNIFAKLRDKSETLMYDEYGNDNKQFAMAKVVVGRAKDGSLTQIMKVLSIAPVKFNSQGSVSDLENMCANVKSSPYMSMK
jgi:hypothetical protein